ncbi:MAG TPA: 3-phosphoshikimate 1-carboxyvinyltransferase [Puia sp.]|nr:3-phosphoshikimate 1-carboxyvinyltransferase [Puia sp.]
MQAIIHPSILKGTIQAPASKSSMQRACAAALLRAAKSIIKNPGYSNDDKAALGVIKALGCQWSMVNGELFVDSTNSFLSLETRQRSSVIVVNCGESGLGIRMFAPILALSRNEIVINGEGSLLNRPMDFFDEVLPQLGVEIVSNNGKLPLKIKGPLQPKDIQIDGSLSSQFLTGLLFAYAASAASDVSIKVKNLKSKPYVDLTLQVMRQFGLRVADNKNHQEFFFGRRRSDNDHRLTINYTVEGDWSGGAFLLVAGAIAGNIVVKGLDINSTQADKKIIEALKDCGCQVLCNNSEFSFLASYGGELRAFQFDATDCPDLFPPLVALAAYCQGETKIKGVKRLAHKESNRAITLQEEFAKMEVEVILADDVMIVKRANTIKGAAVHSHQDHRIAMACAVAALKADGETIIEDAEAISKSYPDFYDHLKSLGARITTNQLIKL